MEKEIKRSKYWPFIVELLEEYFPKHQCKERGRALVLISGIEKILQGDIRGQEMHEEDRKQTKEEIKKLREFQGWFEKFIKKNYGKKCSDFTWDCPVCHAYLVKELFDDFLEDLIETEEWVEKQEKKPKMTKVRK